jgi:hypothetical protein
MNSPYENIPVHKWKTITEQLVADHPLSREEIDHSHFCMEVYICF